MGNFKPDAADSKFPGRHRILSLLSVDGVTPCFHDPMFPGVPCGGSEAGFVPEGRLKIAQQFTARNGKYAELQVP